MSMDVDPVAMEADILSRNGDVELPDVIARFRRELERDPNFVDPNFSHRYLKPFLEAEGADSLRSGDASY